MSALHPETYRPYQRYPAFACGAPGHIGIYAGSGQAIEAAGRKIGVIETPLNKPGTGKKWKKWGKLKDIEYVLEDEVDMKKGDTGETVKVWQEAMLKNGLTLPAYGADGDFGAETEAATKAFQAKYSLSQTGVVDIFTAAAMWSALQNIGDAQVTALKNKIMAAIG